MKEYLLSHGYWFYKDCGCRIPGTLYRNEKGYEVKVSNRTGEFTVSIGGGQIEHGITSHYVDKMQKYL